MAVEPATQSDLTHEEAVKRARRLAVRCRERALRCERERRVPRESIEEFVDAGLQRIFQPRRWGGYEISHDCAADVILEIAAACGNTGWNCSWLLAHIWWFMAFPLEAQHDVYGDGPDVCLAAAFGERQGTAVEVDGGFRLSGHWRWASGVDNCTWIMLGGRTSGGSEQPHARLFLVPLSECRIEDTWYNVGLRGTGSNDVLGEDLFVPEHRSVRYEEIQNCTAPGRLAVTGNIYRLPGKSRNHEIIAPALGAARGAFAHWIEWSNGRASYRTGEVFTKDVHRQIGTAQIEADLDAVELIMRKNLDRIRNGGPIDDPTRHVIHASGVHSFQKICDATTRLLRMGGASALFDSNPIQRAWRDVHAIAAHASLSVYTSAAERGRDLLES
jgi:3-hydroxy-9,10-secoandrosta-1,3,5(10)-triene-9,17-dione monooxygenase